MELIQIVVILIVIAVLLWLVNTYIPMDPTMTRIINAVVIIGVVLWLLFMLLGIFGISTHTKLSLENFHSLKIQNS